jgi:HD superfamily phosphodiesterase
MKLSALFNFIRFTTNLYNMDESHGLSHSMDVFLKADQIFQQEVLKFPYLMKQNRIIQASALIHDACDKKYMSQKEGIQRIRYFLSDKLPYDEIDIVSEIVSKMSYSYVKEHGFPDLGDYQLAYHIVREADLLAAYDIKRSIIYDMQVNKQDFHISFKNSEELFKKRMGKYIEDGLFITETSKILAKQYESQCIEELAHWNTIIDKL